MSRFQTQPLRGSPSPTNLDINATPGVSSPTPQVFSNAFTALNDAVNAVGGIANALSDRASQRRRFDFLRQEAEQEQQRQALRAERLHAQALEDQIAENSQTVDEFIIQAEGEAERTGTFTQTIDVFETLLDSKNLEGETRLRLQRSIDKLKDGSLSLREQQISQSQNIAKLEAGKLEKRLENIYLADQEIEALATVTDADAQYQIAYQTIRGDFEPLLNQMTPEQQLETETSIAKMATKMSQKAMNKIKADTLANNITMAEDSFEAQIQFILFPQEGDPEVTITTLKRDAEIAEDGSLSQSKLENKIATSVAKGIEEQFQFSESTPQEQFNEASKTFLRIDQFKNNLASVEARSIVQQSLDKQIATVGRAAAAVAANQTAAFDSITAFETVDGTTMADQVYLDLARGMGINIPENIQSITVAATLGTNEFESQVLASLSRTYERQKANRPILPSGESIASARTRAVSGNVKTTEDANRIWNGNAFRRLSEASTNPNSFRSTLDEWFRELPVFQGSESLQKDILADYESKGFFDTTSDLALQLYSISGIHEASLWVQDNIVPDNEIAGDFRGVLESGNEADLRYMSSFLVSVGKAKSDLILKNLEDEEKFVADRLMRAIDGSQTILSEVDLNRTREEATRIYSIFSSGSQNLLDSQENPDQFKDIVRKALKPLGIKDATVSDGIIQDIAFHATKASFVEEMTPQQAVEVATQIYLQENKLYQPRPSGQLVSIFDRYNHMPLPVGNLTQEEFYPQVVERFFDNPRSLDWLIQQGYDLPSEGSLKEILFEQFRKGLALDGTTPLSIDELTFTVDWTAETMFAKDGGGTIGVLDPVTNHPFPVAILDNKGDPIVFSQHMLAMIGDGDWLQEIEDQNANRFTAGSFLGTTIPRQSSNFTPNAFNEFGEPVDTNDPSFEGFTTFEDNNG